MTPVSYGSLCTGYDGLGMALALAGVPVEPRWLAEDDEDMSGVLAAEMPGVPNAGDIKAVPWHLAPHVDLMSSGDPCQSISVAGRQLGREDPRFLWPWVRVAYQEVDPGGIFFENVANIVGHDGGRTLAERHGHLREDGYEVRWTVLGACAVGAPHHRHRYYAVAGRWTGPGPVPEAVRVGGAKAICGAPRSGGRLLLPTPRTTDTNGAGRATNLQGGIDLRTAVALLPTPRASDGEKGRGNPGQVYGSGSLPLSGAVALLPTPMADRFGTNQGGAAALLPTPRATDVGTPGRRSSEGWRPQLGQAVAELLLPGVATRPEVWGKFAEAIALWESITGTPAPAPTEPGKNGGRRLSPLLPEWMMGLRPGLLTDRLGRAAALKGAGNGVVPQAGAAAYRMLVEG